MQLCFQFLFLIPDLKTRFFSIKFHLSICLIGVVITFTCMPASPTLQSRLHTRILLYTCDRRGHIMISPVLLSTRLHLPEEFHRNVSGLINLLHNLGSTRYSPWRAWGPLTPIKFYLPMVFRQKLIIWSVCLTFLMQPYVWIFYPIVPSSLKISTDTVIFC